MSSEKALPPDPSSKRMTAGECEESLGERESLLGSQRSAHSARIRPTIYEAVEDTLPSGHSSQSEGIEFQVPSKSCGLCERFYPSGFWSEARKMFQITWPIVLTQVCQMVIGPISLMFCGHLGDAIKLDGAALAISMINATCIAVGQGLGTACDTFFSQTFGSRNKKNVGVYLQKSILIFPFFLAGCSVVMLHMTGILIFIAVLIFLLALFPCVAIHINLEAFLVLIGQHPETARLAGDYLIIFLPGAFSFFMYIILAKYIQNQNIVIPNVVIGLLANAVNALLHYIFLYQLNWETDGSAIAQSISYFLMFVLTLLYILVSKCYRETWDGWSMECLQDWGRFIRLCVPGMLMLCMEWWAFEIGVFLTGVLGTTELGAQSVLLQLDSVWFQVPLGVQISCAIRVGQYLGAGQGIQAKTVGNLAITIVFVLSIFVVILFSTLQYQLPYLFTNVDAVAQLTGDLLPIVTIYVFFDGISTACKGVLYGTGRQIYGAALLFLSYYLLALPIGIPLMFLTDLRNAGYWWALALNLVIQAIVLMVIVFRTKWDDQIIRAQERAGLVGEDTDEVRSLEDKPPKYRRRRLLSASLTKADIEVVLKKTESLTPWQLICRRLLAALLMVSILAAAVVVKVMVKVPEPGENVRGDEGGNYTVYSNASSSSPSSVMVTDS